MIGQLGADQPYESPLIHGQGAGLTGLGRPGRGAPISEGERRVTAGLPLRSRFMGSERMARNSRHLRTPRSHSGWSS